MGGNPGSEEAVGTPGMVTIPTLGYGQMGGRKLLAFPLVPKMLERKRRVVRDLGTSLN